VWWPVTGAHDATMSCAEAEEKNGAGVLPPAKKGGGVWCGHGVGQGRCRGCRVSEEREGCVGRPDKERRKKTGWAQE
jgi:hypothetical protein